MDFKKKNLKIVRNLFFNLFKKQLKIIQSNALIIISIFSIKTNNKCNNRYNNKLPEIFFKFILYFLFIQLNLFTLFIKLNFNYFYFLNLNINRIIIIIIFFFGI